MDSFDFRRLCGRFATGVTIVTAFDAKGLPVGMTANSFASVSLDPPLVSVAVDHAAAAHDALLAASRFTVNILESHQEALSRRFAAGLAERFEGVGWHEAEGGFVVLDGALAYLCCDRYAEYPAGDHTLFLGRALGGESADHGRPLLYYRGGYTERDAL
jgi:flavin reductase (DIM6/NTAB) family NADH-FMN oxidoreductase RutF